MSKNAGAVRMAGLGRFARLCAAVLLAVVTTGQAAQSPEVERGLGWLVSQVGPGGSLAGESGSVARPVQTATDVLHTLAVLETASLPLAQRVAASNDTSTESLARTAIALTHAQRSPANFIVALQQRRNKDGGFGDALGAASNPLDTAWVLLAFRVSGFNDAAILKASLDYLISKSRSDGGYAVPGQSNSVYATSYALQAMVAYRDAYGLSPYISKSVSWLQGARGASGSHGSSLYDALAIIALSAATTDSTQYAPLVAALRSAQAADGSWASDPYLTSLALRALSGKGQPPPSVAQGRVAGRVIDASSRRPLAGAAITVAGLQLDAAADGRFETIGIEPGSYPLAVSRPGYVTWQSEIAIAAAVVNHLGDIELAVQPGGALLHGRVFEGDSGQPLAGVSILVGSGSNVFSAVTTAGGNFEIGGIQASAITVTAQKAGYHSVSAGMQVSNGVSYGFSPALYPESSEVPVKATLRGRIVDNGSGQGIAGAQVGAGGKSAISAADGRFAVAEIEPGPVQIAVSADDYQAATFNVLLAAGDNQGGDLALKSSASSVTIFGKVIEYGSGKVIPGAVVRVQGTAHQAVSNAQGDYRIEGLADRHLTLIVSAAGHYTQTHPFNAADFGSYRRNLSLTKAEDKGLSLTASTNLPSYVPYADVQIAVTATNSRAQERLVVFAARVYDSEHRLVQTFPFRLLAMSAPLTEAAYAVPANASLDLGSKWHARNHATGGYSIVVSAATPEGEVLAETSVGINIEPGLIVGGGIILDPPITQAGISQPVSISALVGNRGNLDYPGGPMRLSVVLDQADPLGPPAARASVEKIVEDDLLTKARGAVSDADGNLYTVNTNLNSRQVLKMTPAGAIKELVKLPSGNILRDITRMPDGSLRVLTTNGLILPVSLSGSVGQPTQIFPGVNSGLAITADEEGNLYAAGGQGNDRALVRIAGSQHTVLLRNGLADPSGSAFGLDGKLYVSNFDDDTIARIDASGRIEPFLTIGLNRPAGLLREPDGNFLVADSGSNRILRVNQAGGTPSVFATGISSPRGLAYDLAGNVLVTAAGSSSLLRVSPTGQVHPFQSGFSTNPTALAYDASGRLHVSSSDGALRRRNEDGTIEALLAAGKLGNPRKLVLGSDGAMYSVGSGSTLLRHVLGSGSVTTHAGGLSGARGLTQDSTGNWLVAEGSGNRITRIRGDGSKETLAQPLMSTPQGVVATADGTRYILSNNMLSRIPTVGRASVLLTSLGGTATDIGLNPAGGVYVLVGTKLMAVSDSGVMTQRATVPSSQRLAVGSDGSVYLSALSAGMIYRLTPDNALTSFSSLPSAVSDFDVHPQGGLVVVLDDGFLYRVAESGSFVKEASAVGEAGTLSVAGDGATYVLLNAGKLLRVGSDGQREILLSDLPQTRGFARLESGSYDIVDQSAATLRQYDADNRLQRVVASFGSPEDVEWVDGAIVFSDSSHGRVYRMSPDDGVPVLLANGMMRQLRYAGGTLYGALGASGRLVRISADGTMTDAFVDGSMTSLQGFAVKEGEMAIADLASHRVVVLDAGGVPQTTYTQIGLTAPTGIAVDSSGRVFVATNRGVVRFGSDGLQAEVLVLHAPKAVAVAADGTVWASSGGTVARLDNGQFVSVASSTAIISSIVFEGNQLYATDSSSLRRLSGNTLPVVATGIDDVVALRVGPDGGIYIAGENGTVKRYGAGVLQQVTNGVPAPRSLAFRNGELYVGDMSNLYHVNVDTGAVLDQSLDKFVGSAEIQGLTVDPQGRLLMVGHTSKAIYRVEPAVVIAPPPPGTEVHSVTASVGRIPINGDPRDLVLGDWIPPYAGDYSLRLQPTDGAAGGSLVGTLHVGPHARGSMTVDRANVPPGETQLGVHFGIDGVDVAELTRIDTAGLRHIGTTSIKPQIIGADPSGNLYYADTRTIVRVKPDGTTATFFTATGYHLEMGGAFPVDAQGNLYIGNSLKQVLRIRPNGTTELIRTMSAGIVDMVVDSRGDLVVALSKEMHRINVSTGASTTIFRGSRPLIQLIIDVHDHLYVLDDHDMITRIRPDGAISMLVDEDIQFEIAQTEPGPRIAADCASNLLIAPYYWPEMGQEMIEEHTLVQVDKGGRKSKIFDGAAVSPPIDDLDFMIYDRYSGGLLVWTDFVRRFSRLPISCGSITANLHVVVPDGQELSGFDPPPSMVVDIPDGGQEYVWTLEGVHGATRTVEYATTLAAMTLGEQRPVATEAFLLFNNSFTGNSIKLPLQVPKVIAGAGTVAMTLATGEASYPAQAAVDITLALEASGPAAQGRLLLELFDANGERVQTLIDENHSVVSGAPLVLNPPLNTGTYVAGAYQLRATFADDAGNLQAKADSSFAILASGGEPGGESAIKVVPTTGKAVYGEFDLVDLLVRARSQASNFEYENLVLKLTVLDPQGTPVHSDSRLIAQLRPGAMVELPGRYELPGASLGMYSLRAEVFEADGSILAQSSSAFEVRADDAAKLSGSVLVGTKSPYVGDVQNCRDTIVNGGTRALNALPLRRRIVDLVANRPVSDELTSLTIEAGGSQVLNRSFSTAGYAVGNHACVLEAEVNGQWKTLGYDSFKTQDAPVTLAGSVTAAVDPVPQGETQTCRDTVRNTGARPASGIPLRRVVLQLSPERRLREDSASISLPPNGEQTDTRVFSTEGFEQGPHACALEARLNNQWQTLAYDQFNVDPPPVRVSATMERGSRGRLLVLMDGAPVNGSSKSEPAPQQQRQFLEALLTREGWSYTIVTDPEAFTWELRSGGYNAYALFSESAKLSQSVQMELREAAYRGEGLLEAGSHDQRHNNFDDALGIKYQGKASQVTGVEVQATEPGPAGYADLALRDKPLKAQLNAASSLGRYLGSKGSDPSAVATRRYGKGRSVYLGYDLLAEATLAGTTSLHAQLLERSLAYVQPDYSQIAAGRVIPLRIRLENEAKPATGQLTLPMPSGASVVDKGTASVSNGVLTWTVDLAQDEDKTYTAWVRLPDAGGSLSFTAQLKIGSSVHTTASLSLNPVATGGLTDALALARPITAFKQVTNWLDKADTALRAGDAETALSHLAKASDELLKVQHASAHDLRLMIDQALLDAGRRLWNG